ncbi:uncharacterized protein RAG0_09504 [Rhynchosporium agropyri]|uniref:Uncharacterized protein n=1 Tax=Rhynchosporium agropyri TaxID=914238 RepID=A0A1E1KVS9_9HELO|nr:uncharacterized protein RAG0_09504 [Rhynchosporium agropyri]
MEGNQEFPSSMSASTPFYQSAAWKIMDEEGRVKWTKIEIISLESQEVSLVDREMRLTMRRELIEDHIAVAKDFLNSMKHTPADFRRTLAIFSSPEFLKSMEELIAFELFSKDVVEFETWATKLINQAGEQVGTSVSQEDYVAQESDPRGLTLLEPDYNTRLAELSDEYTELKSRLMGLKPSYNLKAIKVREMKRKLHVVNRTMRDLFTEIKKTKGLLLFFIELLKLLFGTLSTCTWTISTVDKDGGHVNGSSVDVSAANIFSHLRIHWRVLFHQALEVERARYTSSRQRCLEMTADPRFRGNMSLALLGAVEDSHSRYHQLMFRSENEAPEGN